jgi:sarcosine oxidase, subunit beta
VTGVQTNRGRIACGTVISCVAGWSTLVCDMVDVPLPITTHILQACVTEPVKPLLDKIIVSGTLHIYISQSDRGEFVMGSEIEPYSGYSTKSTFRFIEDLAMHMIELLPMLGHAKILRQWTGLCDVSPDYSPIMGLTEVEGFVIDAGWGTYGFKASPIVGYTLADLVGTGTTPDLIHPFRLARFYEDELVSERGAAAVSH